MKVSYRKNWWQLHGIENSKTFSVQKGFVLRKVYRSEWIEGPEVEERMEHWDHGNVSGSHLRSLVHEATMVDEYLEHPEESPHFAGRRWCRLG